MNVGGRKETFKPTYAAKTRHSAQSNLAILENWAFSEWNLAIDWSLTSHLGCLNCMHDVILHSSFYQQIQLNGQLGLTAYPGPKQGAPVRMGFNGWLARDRKTLIITHLKIKSRYHFISMQWLTKRKSNDRFASKQSLQRTKTGPLGLQVSQAKRMWYQCQIVGLM